MTVVTADKKEKFDWGNYDFGSAGTQWTSPKQPRWKWSYSPTDGLHMWTVDPVSGRPHHIEVTGMQFYKLAQGRVYEYSKGNFECLVWEDRGTPELQDEAVQAVDDWLLQEVGKIADKVTFQTEGGVYQTLDPDNPDEDAMMSAYFGYPVKTKKPQTGTEEKLCTMCDGMGGWTGAELNVDPDYHGEKLDPNKHYNCSRCKGTGMEPQK